MAIMKQNRFFASLRMTVVLLFVLFGAGQKLWANDFTTTYVVSGYTNGNSVTMTLSASGNSTGTYSKSWTNGTDSFIRVVVEGNNYLEITNPSKEMTVSADLFSSHGSTTIVYRNSSNSYRIKHVQLYYGNTAILDSYNIGQAFEYTAESGILFNRIVVTYTNSLLDIDDAVFSGIADHYQATGRGIFPVPMVTWHGLPLTEGTHYTLSYEDNYIGGDHDATITATGIGAFTGSASTTFGITAVTLSMLSIDADGSYMISSADDLGILSAYVSGGNNAEGLTFKQTCDIVIPHTNAWNDNSSTETNLYPIKTFNGSYDGQGHVISGIRMYFPMYTENEYIGLFGKTSASGNKGGTIKNIHLANSRFTGYSSVGGIAGSTWKTTIEDCFVGEDVAFHAVQNSNEYGGIVGFNQSTINRCISHAKFTRANNSLNDCGSWGGIVGHNTGHLYYCLAIGVTMPSVKSRGALTGSDNSDPGSANYYWDCTIGTASTNVGYTNRSGALGDLKGSASEGRAIVPGPGVVIGPYAGKVYTTGYFGITGYGRYPDSSQYDGFLSYNGTMYAGTNENITVALTHENDPEGYTFDSFTTSGTGGENLRKYYGNYYYLTVGTTDVTVSTVMIPHTYTVNFDKNHDDASGSMEPQGFTYGVAQNLTANTFTRPDYVFTRWSTSPDGSGSSYGDAQSVSNLTPEDNGSVTLYAQWQMTGYYNLHLPADSAGTVVAKVGDDENATMAHIGNTVTLTVTPAAGHRLTPGSLTAKYIDADSNLQSLTLTQDPQDESKYSFTMPDYEVTISATFQNLAWIALGEAFTASSDDADNPTVITLDQDYTAASGDSFFSLPAGRHMVLDLNGHTIDRNLSEAIEDGYTIYVASSKTSTLTVRDSSPGKAGTITGGWSTTSCGCIYFRGAALRLEGGNITGNRVNQNGGSAITIMGNMYMTGGSITGNMADMVNSNGAICGTVYFSGSGDLYLSGGSITGNYSGVTTSGCGGISVYPTSSGQIHLSGTYTLSGNHQGTYDSASDSWSSLTPSDCFLSDRYYIYTDTAIHPTAPTALILSPFGYNKGFTKLWNTKMNGKDPADYFLLPNEPGKGIGLNPDGQAEISSLHSITVVGNASANYTSTVQGKRIVIIPSKGKVITSASFIPEGGSATPLTASDGVYSFIMPDCAVTVSVSTEDGNNIIQMARQGVLEGIACYWTSFYDGTTRYTLPEGATAYTVNNSKNLYRLGTDGSVIPAGVAVIIITNRNAIVMTESTDTGAITINGGENILQGSDSAVDVGGLSGTPYVLSLSGSEIGFRQYTGSVIPAHKAYYVVTP